MKRNYLPILAFLLSFVVLFVLCFYRGVANQGIRIRYCALAQTLPPSTQTQNPTKPTQVTQTSRSAQKSQRPQTSRSAQKSQRPQATQSKKTVYLTFDDGPSASVTPAVLSVLKQKNVKATFFIVGTCAEKNSDILKREKEEGHSIGVHSYSHQYKRIYASAKSLLSDIRKCSAVIRDICGITPDIYRFPGGSFFLRSELKEAVREAGLRYYDWNAACRDCELVSPTPGELLQNTIETSKGKNKVILLMHDGSGKKSTAKALSAIIDYFRKNHYVFATL